MRLHVFSNKIFHTHNRFTLKFSAFTIYIHIDWWTKHEIDIHIYDKKKPYLINKTILNLIFKISYRLFYGCFKMYY